MYRHPTMSHHLLVSLHIDINYMFSRLNSITDINLHAQSVISNPNFDALSNGELVISLEAVHTSYCLIF